MELIVQAEVGTSVLFLRIWLQSVAKGVSARVRRHGAFPLAKQMFLYLTSCVFIFCWVFICLVVCFVGGKGDLFRALHVDGLSVVGD